MGAIVLFDGICNFCNASINFIIEHDRAGYFKFAPLQSTIGEELLSKHGISPVETDSVILIEDENAYTLSDAAIRISRRLDGIWSWAYTLRVIPRMIRDLGYRLIARYRYSIFGRRDACMMPTPEVRTRFL